MQERGNSSVLAMELRLSCTIDGLVQERHNSSALAMELSQCKKDSSALAMVLTHRYIEGLVCKTAVTPVC